MQVLEWELLGGEPVPGSPEGVHALADALAARADAALAALGALQSLAGGVGGSGWRGAAADAYVTACGGLGPALSSTADAATTASAALRGFADALQALQAGARTVLDRAVTAERDRVGAEAALAEVTTRVEALTAAHEAARARLEVADADADARLAVGDPVAAVAQADAERLRLEANDALAALQAADAERSEVQDRLTAAEDALAVARADAALLVEDLAAQAAATAASLPALDAAVPDLFRPLHPGAGGAATLPEGTVVLPAAGAVAPAVDAPAGPAGPPATAPLPDAGMIVAAASALARVRLTGTPVPVADVVPDRAVFLEFRGYGLQPVAARGAAVARALGFDGVIGGIGTRAYRSDHAVGLALDLMTYDDVITGQALADFYLLHREELGVTYIIWDGRIASERTGWAWAPYEHPQGRTDPTALHLDHVHISFDDAANPYALACCGG